MKRGHRTTLPIAVLTVVVTGAAGGCLTRPLETEDTRTTSTFVSRLTESGVDKIDLLLMVDNSRSMADKQKVLVEAVPDLVSGLVNPKCVDPKTGAPDAAQPSGPLDKCPDPTHKREFPPVLDIHIGIVTSSLGGRGSDACPDQSTGDCPGGAVNTTNNDHGHLVYRLDPCGGGTAPTYAGQGFLAWDPRGDDQPAGESQVGALSIDASNGNVTTKAPGLVPTLKDMVLGTGQIGCGYEAQLEGWYRFLVDPDPPQSISVDKNGNVQRLGLDQALLQQRADFLRPDSLLAIIGITDENDASVKENGQYWLVYQQMQPGDPAKPFHMPRPRHECATNPNDPCCRSCAESQDGCPADPVCQTGPLTAAADDPNLRAWDQKRRFGIDFLYPVQRYVDGLTQAEVPDRTGKMVPNPIFSSPKAGKGGNIRDPSLVFLAYITGVPWQDIARDPKDLTKGFKDAAELATPDAHGHTTWDYIVGDPASYVEPLDPHMIESNAPRTGRDPITGDTIAPPAKTEGGPDALNGHEYTPGTAQGVQQVANDLEYACIFELPAPRDCSAAGNMACDCTDPKNDNPLCADNGAKGRTLQTHAKAYPAIRELEVLKKLGPQGIAASICPAQIADLSRDDFGYRPAIGAIIDRLKQALGGQCLPRKLSPDKTGLVECLILEANNTGGKHAADCDAYCDGKTTEALLARQHVQPEHQPAVDAAKQDPLSTQVGWDCFCEIKQLSGATTPACTAQTTPASALDACQCDPSDPPSFQNNPVNGWCYVDGMSIPTVGNADIVKSCPDDEKRLVRFAGAGNPQAGSTVFITCAGE